MAGLFHFGEHFGIRLGGRRDRCCLPRIARGRRQLGRLLLGLDAEGIGRLRLFGELRQFSRELLLAGLGPRGGLGQPAARPEVPEERAAADKLEREKDVRRVLCGFNSPPPFFLNSISFCVFLFRFS